MTIVSPLLADIIIPTHERPDLLSRALKALGPQLRRSTQARVIVVNDGTDSIRYRKVLEAYEDIISYYPLPSKKGPAHARNEGARLSSAQFVAFLDDDCVVPSHWLNWLLAMIETMPTVDVFGGPTRPPGIEDNPHAIERFNRTFGFFPRPLFRKGELYCLPSANVAVRREAFLYARGFDIGFRYAAGEDLNLFYRLKKSGVSFYIDNQWYVVHPVADKVKTFVNRWYRYGYGTAQHRIRSDDPHDYGFNAQSNYLSILSSLPNHVRYLKRQLANGQRGDWLDTSNSKLLWEKVVFPLLASIRQIAYQMGGAHAFSNHKQSSLEAPEANVRHVTVPELLIKPTTPHTLSVSKPLDVIQPLNQQKLTSYGLILGAPKCGTSALFGALAAHPEIVPCKLKEPSFFLSDTEFEKGADWYRNLFPYKPEVHRIGIEATTRNSMFPTYQGCARRMLQTKWSFRFVYVVRNPFDRIQSHYMHASVVPLGIPPLSEGLHTFPLEVTAYYTQIKQYLDVFGKESILVLQHDDLIRTPRSILQRICDHLEISHVPALSLETIHSGEYHYGRELLLRELRSRYIVSDELSVKSVHDYLDTLGLGDREDIENSVRAQYTLNEEHRIQIRAALREEMHLIQREFGINVTEWGF
jgi:GT2 family glycosyltransferase